MTASSHRVRVDEDRAGGHEADLRHRPDHLTLHQAGRGGPVLGRGQLLSARLQLLRCGVAAETEGLTDGGSVCGPRQTLTDVEAPGLVCSLGARQAVKSLLNSGLLYYIFVYLTRFVEDSSFRLLIFLLSLLCNDMKAI